MLQSNTMSTNIIYGLLYIHRIKVFYELILKVLFLELGK